jgi:hypothetical protein
MCGDHLCPCARLTTAALLGRDLVAPCLSILLLGLADLTPSIAASCLLSLEQVGEADERRMRSGSGGTADEDMQVVAELLGQATMWILGIGGLQVPPFETNLVAEIGGRRGAQRAILSQRKAWCPSQRGFSESECWWLDG